MLFLLEGCLGGASAEKQEKIIRRTGEKMNRAPSLAPGARRLMPTVTNGTGTPARLVSERNGQLCIHPTTFPHCHHN